MAILISIDKAKLNRNKLIYETISNLKHDQNYEFCKFIDNLFDLGYFSNLQDYVNLEGYVQISNKNVTIGIQTYWDNHGVRVGIDEHFNKISDCEHIYTFPMSKRDYIELNTLINDYSYC